MASTDGVNWAPRNDGIDEIFMVANMNFWVDGLGHGDGDGLAAFGDDLYVVTASGKIFVLMGEGGGTTSTSGETAGTDTGGGSSGQGTDSGAAETGTPTTGGGEGSSGGSSGGGPASDGASGGSTDDDAGCACRSSREGEPAGALVLVGLTLGACASTAGVSVTPSRGSRGGAVCCRGSSDRRWSRCRRTW